MKQTVTCQFCQKEFPTYSHNIEKGWAKFCSRGCHNQARAAREPRQCLRCQATFYAWPSTIKNRDPKYCSQSCANLAHQKRVTLHCLTCDKEILLCEAHAERGNGKYCSKACQWNQDNSITVSARKAAQFDKYLDKSPEHNGCWIWTGERNKAGYGTIRVLIGTKRTRVLAHRYAWEQVNGPIPEGLCCLHTCDNPPCIRAGVDGHLFLGSNRDNTMDKVAKGRQTKGEQVYYAKLTDNAVMQIRNLAAEKTIKELALQFDVHRSTIEYVLLRKTWKHLP